jgi:hypothetical protein
MARNEKSACGRSVGMRARSSVKAEQDFDFSAVKQRFKIGPAADVFAAKRLQIIAQGFSPG